MPPNDCPKWNGCNAPLCPLDPHSDLRRHMRGEPVCLWLRELAKPGGAAIVRGAVPTAVADALLRAAPNLSQRNSDMRAKLRAASRNGSKLACGRRLHGGSDEAA